MRLSQEFVNSKYWYTVTLLALVLIYIHTFGKIFLNTGDHGRDLMSYLLSSQGYLPYIDYHWIYGPLMPFYYALLFKILGSSILTAITGWYVIFSLTLFVYFSILKKLFNPAVGCIVTILFTGFYGFFFHTFNHVAGTFLITLVLYFFIQYITEKTTRYLVFTAIFLAVLGLVKLNIMLSLFLCCFSIIAFINYKDLIKFSAIVFLPQVFIYGLFILLSPEHSFYSIFPYKSNLLTHGPDNLFVDLFKPLYIAPSIVNIKNFFILAQYKIFYAKITYFILLIPALAGLVLAKKDNKSFSILLFLVIASILCNHEYLLVGNDYSLRFWVLPIILLAVAFSLMLILERLDNIKINVVLFVVVIYISVFGVLITFLCYQNSFVNLNLERAKVQVYPPTTANLIYTTTLFIDQNTDPNDTILAIPYNSLYNFLSKRQSPSKINEFLYQTNLTTSQENKVIEDLQKNKTKLVLLSNMVSEKSLGTGIFGQTHAQKLAQYLKENYIPVNIIAEFFDENKHLAYGTVITILKHKD